MNNIQRLLFACALCMTAMVTITYSQSSLQVIGSFPKMDGGFEGQNAGALRNYTGFKNVITTDWTVNATAPQTVSATVNSTGGRSGPQYVNYYFSAGAATGRPIQSPTTASQAIKASTQYTVQYYYRSGATATNSVMNVVISPNGTASIGGYTQSTAGALAATNNTWQKVVVSLTIGATADTNYGLAGVRAGGPMGTAIDIDDFVAYAGTPDNTPPDAPTGATILTNAGTELQVGWTAPVNGVDGGGYMVVRSTSDPTTPPNINGIYAVGNTIGSGIGSGQVVYLGTNTSFYDVGLSPSATYYYEIYSVDKAFNYSSPIGVIGATTSYSPASEPTLQASSVGFSSISATQFAVSWAAGNGSNHLVVVRAGSDVNADPADGATYTANTAYGTAGAQLGTGNYVVYNSTGTGVTVTGLSKTIKYYVRVYELNGSSGTENYLTASPASSSQQTPPGEVVSNNTGGGSWTTATSWAGGVLPTATDNVTITGSDVITTFVGGTHQCYNLTVQSGAKLKSNTAVTGTTEYVTVYGSTITVNGGTLGGTPGTDCAFGIYFIGNVTLTGSGTIRLARVIPTSSGSMIGASFTFDADATMTYTGATATTGASSIYTENSGGTDNITITVNAGKTLTFVDYSYLTMNATATNNGLASSTFNLNGTINLSGTHSILSLRTAVGKTCVLNIGGTGAVTVGNSLYAASGTNGAAPSLSVAGSLTIGATTGTADFSSPTLSGTVTGVGTFTLSSGASMSIGAASGLNNVSGPIRTTTRSFSSGANYSFTGTVAQATGADLPAIVNNLTINNATGVTLSNATTTVAGTLTMTAGNLALNGNTLTLGTSIGSPGTLTYTAGYLTGIGTFTRWIASTIAISGTAGTFPMGVGSNKRSVTIGGTPSTGGTISVAYNDASTVSTPFSGGFTENSQLFVNRYGANWVVAQSGLTFTAITLAINGNGIPGITAIADLNISLATGPALDTYAAPSGATTATPVVNRAGLTQDHLPGTYYFASTSSSALPVEMTSFSASMQGANCALLKWSTATEVNNSGFEIQRRAESATAWAKVGFVAGAGTSNSQKEYTYQDVNLAPGVYVYRIKQIDNDGAFKYSASTQVDAGVAKGFELLSNYPNPFNPATEIRFSVPEDGFASLKVYNMLGQVVATLFDGMAKSGHYVSVTFSASEMASGVYFSRLEYNGRNIVQRMLLAK